MRGSRLNPLFSRMPGPGVKLPEERPVLDVPEALKRFTDIRQRILETDEVKMGSPQPEVVVNPQTMSRGCDLENWWISFEVTGRGYRVSIDEQGKHGEAVISAKQMKRLVEPLENGEGPDERSAGDVTVAGVFNRMWPGFQIGSARVVVGETFFNLLSQWVSTVEEMRGPR